MNSILVSIPAILKIDGSIVIQQLINDVNTAIQSNQSTVEFDFSNSQFIAGEMTVLLGMLLTEVKKSGKKYRVNGITDNVSKALTRNNFLPYFMGGTSLTDIYNNTIQFYCGNARDDDSLNKYLDDQVFKNDHWVDVTSGQQEKEKISSAIHELAINVYEHSTVNKVLCCGQYYPNMHKLSFALGDNGISIPASVSTAKFDSDSNLIDWATQKGTSTKNEVASGLGLYSVKNKLTSSGGLTIISRNGYWRKASNLEKGAITMFELDKSPLNGTFIHFSLDMNEQVTNNVNNNNLQNLFF